MSSCLLLIYALILQLLEKNAQGRNMSFCCWWSTLHIRMGSWFQVIRIVFLFYLFCFSKLSLHLFIRSFKWFAIECDRVRFTCPQRNQFSLLIGLEILWFSGVVGLALHTTLVLLLVGGKGNYTNSIKYWLITVTLDLSRMTLFLISYIYIDCGLNPSSV